MAGDWGISGAVENAGRHVEGKQEREHMEEMSNRASERDWSRNVIQKTVNDARAAGIHPLFAMGVSPHSSAPVSIGGGGGGGADLSGLRASLSKAFDREGARREDELHRAQLDVLQSEAHRNNAVAQNMVMSTLARGTQPGTAGGMGTIISPDGLKVSPVEVTPVPAGAQFRSALTGKGIPLRPEYDMGHSQLGQNRWGEPGEWVEGASLYVREVIAPWIREGYRHMLDTATGARKEEAERSSRRFIDEHGGLKGGD